MGRLLLQMRAGGLFRNLGFVRLGDYVGERLGLSYRTAQELMRVAESLERLPVAAAAFDRGRITSGHVRALTRVATPESERSWVEQAERSGVREFTRTVSRRAAASGRAGIAEGTDDEPPLLQCLHVPAPAWMASLWRETVTHVRWLVGQFVPAGPCLEFVLAEQVAGLPATADLPEVVAPREGAGPSEAAGPQWEDARTPPRAPEPIGAPVARRPFRDNGKGDDRERFAEGAARLPDGRSDPATRGRERTESAAPEMKSRAEVGAGFGDAAPPGPAPKKERCRGEGVAGAGAAGDSPPDVDAREIDRELRRLVTERQRQEAELASLLRSVASERTYSRLGFPSLEEYAYERFGLSSRQTYYLLALERFLESLPGVSAAFFAGKITLRKTLLVAGVATRSTEALWIERAAGVTLRRLEDEVTYWRHLRETRPEVWTLLRGGPLPEDLALVPGQPPRLRKSDEARCACATGPSASEARARVELHGSARSTPVPEEPSGQVEDSRVGGASPAHRPHGHSCGAGPVAASNRASPVPAEEFLKALNEAEAVVPLPSRICHLRMNVEPDLMTMWRERVRHLRATVRRDLAEWEVLALALRDFWRTWDNPETRRQRRVNRTLERDGWRCTAPGCRSVGSGRLHEHHIVFRSAGEPPSDASNLTTLCTGHHLGLLHRERMRCGGMAPDRLTWEMGIQPGKAPFSLFENERLIAGAS